MSFSGGDKVILEFYKIVYTARKYSPYDGRYGPIAFENLHTGKHLEHADAILYNNVLSQHEACKLPMTAAHHYGEESKGKQIRRTVQSPSAQ